ncbi:MAG: FUN14 domain-containing protein [Candidatus Muiribacteriota bacterium]
MKIKNIFLLILIFATIFCFAADESAETFNIDNNDTDSIINSNFLVQLIAMLGFGGLIGFVTGFAVNKVARLFAILLGIVFIVIQIMAFQGWITVDWNAIAQTADVVDEKQAGVFFHKFLNVVTNNLPFGGSFIAGFFIGLKKR